MKQKDSIVFLLLILLLSFGICGCTSSIISKQQDASSRSPDARIGFDHAYSSLTTSGNFSKLTPMHVYYIRGTDLDSSAAAKEWIFGIKQGNASYFYSYNPKGGSTTSWPWDFPYREIQINDTFLYPKELFIQHKLFIQDMTGTNSPNIDELELMDGTYRLSMKNSTSSITILYDGQSGKEIM